MQVYGIKNDNYNPKFRGRLDKSVPNYITKRIKKDIYDYAALLNGKEAVDKKILTKIYETWTDILRLLEDNVKPLHKDTILKVEELSSTGLCAENTKLKSECYLTTLEPNNYYNYMHFISNYMANTKDVKQYVEKSINNEIDNKLLLEAKRGLNRVINMVINSEDPHCNITILETNLNTLSEFMNEIGKSDKQYIEKSKKHIKAIKAKIASLEKAELRQKKAELRQRDRHNKNMSDVEKFLSRKFKNTKSE